MPSHIDKSRHELLDIIEEQEKSIEKLKEEIQSMALVQRGAFAQIDSFVRAAKLTGNEGDHLVP